VFYASYRNCSIILCDGCIVFCFPYLSSHCVLPSFFIKMKALTMSKLRKKGDIPITPKDRHSMNIGTGNYNRFAPLQPPPPGRSRINSKRKYDDESPVLDPKTPRLDANLVFSQLKASDEAVSEIKQTSQRRNIGRGELLLGHRRWHGGSFLQAHQNA
jgi:hypothetical protein